MQPGDFFEGGAELVGKVVLVTGAARQLGGRFVRRIQREPDVERVIAVDAVTPSHRLGSAEFVRTDIRQSAIARVLTENAVDTVVHLAVTGGAATGPGAASYSTVKETNVIGTMQLLGACQKSPTVRRLVVKSSTSVYGGTSRDPAVFTETTQPKSLPAAGFAKDAVEVEGYVRGFARRRPDVAVCVLRFANILGPFADSALAEYFSMPLMPTVLGYDPRLQFVHEDDVLDVLRLAAQGSGASGTTGTNGTFNIAGDGVLLLSQCARRLGRPAVPLPLPAVTWVGSALRAVGATDFSPEQIRLLTHGRVVETSQMREVLGFDPMYTTAETFADFTRSRGGGLLPPERVGRAVDRVAELLNVGDGAEAGAGAGAWSGAGPAAEGAKR